MTSKADPSELEEKDRQGKDYARLSIDLVFEALLGSLRIFITDAYNPRYLSLIMTRSEITHRMPHKSRRSSLATPQHSNAGSVLIPPTLGAETYELGRNRLISS